MLATLVPPPADGISTPYRIDADDLGAEGGMEWPDLETSHNDNRVVAYQNDFTVGQSAQFVHKSTAIHHSKFLRADAAWRRWAASARGGNTVRTYFNGTAP